MKQKSVKKLEVGRDYINSYNSIIVIDRVGDFDNIGFYGKTYYNNLACHNPAEWRKATEEEVIEAFERHLIHRYGEDWKTMKIKEKHPDSHPAGSINNNSYVVDFSKTYGDWRIWNNNGLLYCHGVWVERLEEVEEPEIHIQDAIKENTVIHCETEQEANRILGMAESLGYKWWMGENYENNTEWGICKSTMCYDLFNGSYSDYDYFKKNDYTIIPSTQIADLEPEKSTDWIPDLTPAPEDIEAMNKKEKASKTQIGGNHYSNMAIQPTEFIHKNNLSFIQGNVIKYVCRYKSKGGIEDLQKAKHYIDLLIEFEEENN